MFSTVLIANRGEIALRIIRTCRSMGIRTVVVYSEADAGSRHCKEADIAVPIGGYTPRESYLSIEKIIEAAQKSGADAIHPGYGFLSENFDFAEATMKAGLTFIGPSPQAIRALGDKTSARKLAIEAKTPISPGSTGAVYIDQARIIANDIGFPVLLKAAAGGGGKGMRLVESADEFESAFKSAAGEALAAFGDDRMFVEKFIDNPRHIEIQVLADNYGTIFYFPERECSIQRRHQKVIEESPSAAVTPEIRQAMSEAAARLVNTAGYTNAGTLEFLLDASGKFYFMEVNTRLQVEHPVTEMITGVDLVEQQLRIAAGEKLLLTQEQIKAKGHAIECRICAEDVYNDFLPETGIVNYVKTPVGEHVRSDDALYVGYEVSVNYDSMVGKLICWGNTRNEAIDRSINALNSYCLSGLRTTIPFCQSVLDSALFRKGDYSTHYIAEHWKPEIPQELHSILAAAAVIGSRSIDSRRKPIYNYK